MATKILMPQAGQDIEIGEVAYWAKREGEPVRKGEVLCEIETEKGVFEVPCPEDGVLLKILVPAGRESKILSVIGVVGKLGEPFELEPYQSEQQPTADAVDSKGGRFEDRRQARTSNTEHKIAIAPRARRIAEEMGIPLGQVVGSGPHGRVTAEDVIRAAGQAMPPSEQGAAMPFGEPNGSQSEWASTWKTRSQAAPNARVSYGRWEKGTINSKALASNLLGDPPSRSFYVYLPPSYDSGGRAFPVAYVLHQFQGTCADGAILAPQLDRLIADHKAQEVILVFPDATNRLGGGFYQSSPTIGDYETYITKELVSQIDQRYRTLADRGTRAVVGCSMGGYGSLHLALTYPDVFGIAVAMSCPYDWQDYQGWEADARTHPWHEAKDFREYRLLPSLAQYLMAAAAVAAPNSNQPPFYLDMPFRMVNGVVEVVPEVFHKIADRFDRLGDVRRYLSQPARLDGLMICHGTQDTAAFFTSVVYARAFERKLTELGVSHNYVELKAGHCDYDMSPSLEFISAHFGAVSNKG